MAAISVVTQQESMQVRRNVGSVNRIHGRYLFPISMPCLGCHGLGAAARYRRQ